MLMKKHYLASQLDATHELYRQLLVQQQRFEEFVTEQFQDVSTRLNDLLTLMPTQHTVTLVPETPPANIRAHTPHLMKPYWRRLYLATNVNSSQLCSRNPA